MYGFYFNRLIWRKSLQSKRWGNICLHSVLDGVTFHLLRVKEELNMVSITWLYEIFVSLKFPHSGHDAVCPRSRSYPGHAEPQRLSRRNTLCSWQRAPWSKCSGSFHGSEQTWVHREVLFRTVSRERLVRVISRSFPVFEDKSHFLSDEVQFKSGLKSFGAWSKSKPSPKSVHRKVRLKSSLQHESKMFFEDKTQVLSYKGHIESVQCSVLEDSVPAQQSLNPVPVPSQVSGTSDQVSQVHKFLKSQNQIKVVSSKVPVNSSGTSDRKASWRRLTCSWKQVFSK